MNEKALGVIETMGLVPAIEAADTGLKTAHVTLESLELVGGGLVAVLIRGDISSVKAAVGAGSAAAKRLGQVISTTVIARTAEGLENIIGSTPDNGDNETTPEQNSPAEVSSSDKVDYPPEDQLKLMNVVKLRVFARTLEGYTMTREEIRSARKQDLIENILKHYRQRGMSHD